MSDNIDGSGLAFLAAAALFWTIFAIGFYILSSIFLMKIFEKAGVQGKWRAWVPIYNYMVFSKLGDLSPWLILIVPHLRQDLAPHGSPPSRTVAPASPPGISNYSATALGMSTVTPGPMVEESAIFFR